MITIIIHNESHVIWYWLLFHLPAIASNRGWVYPVNIEFEARQMEVKHEKGTQTQNLKVFMFYEEDVLKALTIYYSLGWH